VLVVASLEFVAAMVVAQLGYPGYSDLRNQLSDLGGPNSPRAFLFNVSVVLLGLLAIGGVTLVRSAFRKGFGARAGLGLLALAGVGAVGVGLFPEGSPVHVPFAGIGFFAAGGSLLFFALGMLRDTRWDGYRLFSFVAGLVTFVGIALYSGPSTLGLGAGGAERLIIAPLLLWSVVVGVHLLRLPVYGGPLTAFGGSTGEPR
jgi:hypothetical membrane protein